MSAPRETFLSLLRLALDPASRSGNEGLCQDLYRRSAAEWADLLALSREQAVTGLVGEALSLLTERGPGIPDSISTEFMLEMDRTERNARKVRKLSVNLLGALKDAGLHPVLMKGPAVARYYPAPDLRTPGDIDLYIPRSEWQEALSSIIPTLISRPSVKGAGPLTKAPDGSAHYLIDGIDIDLHPKYFDLVPERKERVLPPVPSHEAELLMLSLHILKHAMGPGIGIRQVCDYAMAWRALEGGFDSDALTDCHRSLGTLRWHHLLHDFVSRHFSCHSELPSCHSERSEESAALETIIFSGGNFGHHAASRSKALAGASFFRKFDTLKRYLHRAPFALKYAPKPYCAYIRTLATGNISRQL